METSKYVNKIDLGFYLFSFFLYGAAGHNGPWPPIL
jgi:hypothetical protein